MYYMKHVANRSKSTVKAKAKTLTQVKSIKKTKPVAKNPIGKVASNSRRQKPVQKAKSAAAKIAPKNSPRVAKPTVKKAVPKLSAKTLNALKTISARRAKPVTKQTEKPKAKKIALKTSTKRIKISASKTKPVSPVKKVTAVGKKIKKIITAQNTKPTTAPAAKPKVSVKASAKTSVRTAKSQSSKVTSRMAKPRRPKLETLVKTKIKSSGKKAKPIIAAKKPKSVGKTKPVVAAKPIIRKKVTPVVSANKVNRKSKKAQPTVLAKKIVRKTGKVKPIAAIKKVVTRTQRLKPAISAARVEKPNRKNKKASSVRKIKPVENVIEAVVPHLPKPKNRKARPISSAVFRGKKARYDFKVFALNEKFEPIPAVYIISKRKTDRHKRGHHALICIGETASISDELKRHRKGKCVKKHEANVVSILPEGDEKIRLKIETDLKAAHSVVCNFE
jgi:hypothetical protein